MKSLYCKRLTKIKIFCGQFPKFLTDSSNCKRFEIVLLSVSSRSNSSRLILRDDVARIKSTVSLIVSYLSRISVILNLHFSLSGSKWDDSLLQTSMKFLNLNLFVAEVRNLSFGFCRIKSINLFSKKRDISLGRQSILSKISRVCS